MTHLLSCLVKHLALCTQRVGSVDQIIQFFAALKNRLDGLVLHVRCMSERGEKTPKGELTKMILVSSSSAWTFMMLSAWRGSWYFVR